MLFRPFYRHIVLTIALPLLLACSPAEAQGQQPAKPPVELTATENGLTVSNIKESFSTLSLEGSDLRPMPPMSTDHEKNADFLRELVRVQWRPNDPIDMYVIRPPQVKNPPVVLYLYGFPSELDRFRDNRYCARVVKNGAAAVGFLSARTGYRAEHGPPKLWFVSQLPESLGCTVHDVQLILNYLATRGDLDMGRVGMFGQGSGGAIAVLAAAADSRIEAIDLLDPWGDWPDWLANSPMVPNEERDGYLKADFLKQVEPLEPVRYLPKLASRAIRIQLCDEENKFQTKAVAKIEAAAPKTAKVLHYPSMRAMYAVSTEGRLFEWIATALKSPIETKQASAKTLAAPTTR